jgi:putative nucleotidyltransferase with HDIG domain
MNAVLSLAAGMLTVNDISQCLLSAGYAFATAIACMVVCLGTLPLWERIFDVLTPTKLMEISNSEQPLIHSLMMEAPGTYHHSLIVANMAGQACEEIGANSLLARAGALYHDIGKLKNPLYFKENQIGMDNPHDGMPPADSADVLKAHVKDGVSLAIKNKVPRAIIDIIAQHHGSATIQYFYSRALSEGIPAELRDYAYLGPKPQTAEAAVVMLADAVEAAVRADASLTMNDIEARVQKLIHARMEDGQLSDCPLTFGDLGTIQRAFMSVFYGMKHERIEYPERS